MLGDNEMKIREIKEEDLDKITYLAFHAQKREVPFDPILRLSEDAQYYIHSWLKENLLKGGKILIAEHEGEIVGFIWGWIVQKPLEIFKVENIGYIYQVYVKEQLKNTTLKDKLLESITRAFKEEGIKYIIADCYIKDTENIELYKSQGFEPRALTLMKKLEE